MLWKNKLIFSMCMLVCVWLHICVYMLIWRYMLTPLYMWVCACMCEKSVFVCLCVCMGVVSVYVCVQRSTLGIFLLRQYPTFLVCPCILFLLHFIYFIFLFVHITWIWILWNIVIRLRIQKALVICLSLPTQCWKVNITIQSYFFL